jgi:hypothetical protein
VVVKANNKNLKEKGVKRDDIGVVDDSKEASGADEQKQEAVVKN